jgi:UrcA family protein
VSKPCHFQVPATLQRPDARDLVISNDEARNPPGGFGTHFARYQDAPPMAQISAVNKVDSAHHRPKTCNNQMEIAMKNLTTLAAIATFATCSLTIARAETAVEPRSVTVRFSDLDTTNAAGVTVLFQRLKNAAASVCRDLEPGRQVALMEPYANCVRQAIGNAVVKIDRPTVTAHAVAHGDLPGDATIRIARNK